MFSRKNRARGWEFVDPPVVNGLPRNIRRQARPRKEGETPSSTEAVSLPASGVKATSGGFRQASPGEYPYPWDS